MTSCVYFIGIEGQPYVKVGRTINMADRVSTLYTSTPFNLEEIGRVDGGYEIESMCHNALVGHRVRGEWFKRDAAVDLCRFLKSAPTVEDGIAQYKAQFPKPIQYTRKQYLADVAAILQSILENRTVQEIAAVLGVSDKTVKNARDGKFALQADAMLNLLLLKPDALDAMFSRWGRVTEPKLKHGDISLLDNTFPETALDAAIEALSGMKSRCLTIREGRAA